MSPKIVTPNIPKKTVVPSAWRISAPAPLASTRGTTPRATDTPSAPRQRQGYDAEDEREARHQNRAQAKTRGFDGGVRDALARVFDLFCKLDDEDRVLARKAHQHDEADLGEDVVVHVPQPHASDGAEQTHRHNQNDGERQTPAFVLGGEREKHEQHAERENEHDG